MGRIDTILFSISPNGALRDIARIVIPCASDEAVCARPSLRLCAHHGQEWHAAKVNDLRSGVSATGLFTIEQPQNNR